MAFLRDLGGGNPLSTPVGQLIEKATNETQASENWALYMEICDLINETDDGPKDAMRAMKRRLSTCVGKNYTLVMYTLILLETCVKNCGKRFHQQLATKDTMQELLRIISPKNDPPTIVQEKVLSLIQTWSDAFQGSPELKEVSRVYQELKSKGIDFPMTDLDHMVPIHTPAKTTGNGETLSPRKSTSSRSEPSRCVQSPAAVLPPGALSPQQMAKLRSELEIVERNAAVLSDMLTELTPGKEGPADAELLVDLNRTCRSMQQRVVELVGQGQSEDVTNELLRVNDLLNNIFVRYDRHERGRLASEQATLPIRQPADGGGGGGGGVTAAATGADGAAVGNLIDLDTPQPRGNDDLSPRLASMNVGSGDVSRTLGQPNSPPGGRPAGGGDDRDFDMFAQSRQSFEQNKQSSDNYVNQTVDQYGGGLSAAVNVRSTGQPQELSDKASDLEEMESYLRTNPQAAGGNNTTAEFDRFLAGRADDRGQPAAPGRQIQKGDEDKALFSL